jgi:tetratricopeptide (TPR) repeat protein
MVWRFRRKMILMKISFSIPSLVCCALGPDARAQDFPCLEHPRASIVADRKFADAARDLGEAMSRVDEVDPDRAINGYQRAAIMFARAKDADGEATTFNNIGVVLRRIGRYDESLVYHERALAIRMRLAACAEMAVSSVAE